jgi:D-lyxose ketol-isomerase
MAGESGMSRRTLIKTAGVGAAALLAGKAGRTLAAEGKGPMRYKNSDFYQDGKLQVDKAKQAYFDMMERFKYPIPKNLREGIWVLDFALNDFVNVGMGGIFWWNDQPYGYFGHEIYLLPGQMIAEHAHVKTAKGPAKMEAWHTRHGMVYLFGEGEETRPCPVKLPESHAKHVTVKHVAPLRPGEVVGLNRPTAKHFMMGGPEGAIVTEYATFHDNDGLRFSHPDAKL